LLIWHKLWCDAVLAGTTSHQSLCQINKTLTQTRCSWHMVCVDVADKSICQYRSTINHNVCMWHMHEVAEEHSNTCQIFAGGMLFMSEPGLYSTSL
jgi:hypothetical protein